MVQQFKCTAFVLAAAVAGVFAEPANAGGERAFKAVGYPYATDITSAATLANGRVIAAPLASGPWSLQANGYPLVRLNADGMEGMLDIQEINEGVIALVWPYRPTFVYHSVGSNESYFRATEARAYMARSSDGGASWQKLNEPGFPEIDANQLLFRESSYQRGNSPRLVALPDGRAVLSRPFFPAGIWRRQNNQWSKQPSLPSPYCSPRFPESLMVSMSASGEVLTNDTCGNLVIQSQPGGAFVPSGVTNVRAISRQQGAHLYVATTTDLYRRDGASFVRVSSLPAPVVSAIPTKREGLVLDTLADGTVALAINTSLYASRDRGVTWTQVNYQGTIQEAIKQVVGRTANAAYVVSQRTADRYDLTNATAMIVSRKPVAPVYVGLKATAAGAPLSISDTNITYRVGASWRSVDAVPGLYFADASVAPDGTVFATMANASVLNRTNGPIQTDLYARPLLSANWELVPSPSRNSSAWRIQAFSATHLLSYAPGGGVFFSLDGGVSWDYSKKIASDGTVMYGQVGPTIQTYAESPTAIYAFDGYVVYKSEDGGRTFYRLYSLSHPGMPVCRSMVVALNEALICATLQGVEVASMIAVPPAFPEPEIRWQQTVIATTDADPRHYVESLAINTLGELLIMGPFGAKLASPFTGSPTDAWTNMIEPPYMTKIQFPRAVSGGDDFYVVRDGAGIHKLKRY